MHEHIQEILLSEQQIQEKVKALGAQITRDYQGKDLLAVFLLKGSYIFAADLTRAVDLPLEVDCMTVSSYGSGAKSSGNIRIIQDVRGSIENRHVLIIEDIIDSGNTLSHLIKLLQERNPASVEICTLLDKPSRRVTEISAKYTGFTVPDAFVAGYGLDYAEKYRNLPYIGILKKEVYEK